MTLLPSSTSTTTDSNNQTAEMAITTVSGDRPASLKSDAFPDEKTLNSGSDTEVVPTPPEPEPGAVDDKKTPLAPGSVAEQEVEGEQVQVLEQQWLEGVQLFAVLGSVTLVIFLMLLDMTIISTVCLLFLFTSMSFHLIFSVRRDITDGNFHRQARQLTLISCCLQAIPQITQEFQSLGDVGWYGSAYNLARYVNVHPVHLIILLNCIS